MLFVALIAAIADPVVVPVAREPHHHVVFQNDNVRVIDAQLAPGDVSLYHTHARDNVPVCIAGGSMTNQPLGGTRTSSTALTGAVSFATATYTHQIANTGASALHFVDVELAADRQPAGGDPGPLPAGHTVEMENARVRVLRVAAGSVSHVHPRPILEVVLAGSSRTERLLPRPPGAVAWHEAGQAIGSTASADVIEIELK